MAFFDHDFGAAADLLSEGLGEEVQHFPGGDEEAAETVLAVIDEDSLDESSGGDGAGVNTTNEKGTGIRQAAKLEIPASVVVTEDRGKLSPSTWSIGGVKWVTKRILARDSARQIVLIVRVERKTTARTQTVP